MVSICSHTLVLRLVIPHSSLVFSFFQRSATVWSHQVSLFLSLSSINDTHILPLSLSLSALEMDPLLYRRPAAAFYLGAHEKKIILFSLSALRFSSPQLAGVAIYISHCACSRFLEKSFYCCVVSDMNTTHSRLKPVLFARCK